MVEVSTQQVHTKSFQDPLHLQEILDDFGGLFPETTVTVGWFPGSGLPVHRDDCQVGDGFSPSFFRKYCRNGDVWRGVKVFCLEG